MTAGEKISANNIISKHEFYFETPLYELIENSRLPDDLLEGDVDAYSAQNGIETTYAINYNSANKDYERSFNDFLKIILTCKRKGDDRLRFFIIQTEDFTIKVGQFPSLADIQFAEIGKKYDKLLGRDELKEFKRAIGLAAHGVGAGSFVYLRRIFEKLILQTFEEHKTTLNITEKDFLQKRMEEKVELLKKHLPSQLVEMKKIYAILSKGVHELEEQECLQYFPALKLSIELILEQQIEMEMEKRRNAEVKRQIQDIGKSLNKLD